MACTKRWLYRIAPVLLLAATASTSFAVAAPPGMTVGTVDLGSTGPMVFADSGVLLIGDPKMATLYAIDTQDSGKPSTNDIEINDLIAKIESITGASGRVDLGELAVNPETGNTFLSISVEGQVMLMKVTGDGEMTTVDLAKVSFMKKALPSPPADRDFIRRGRNRNPRLSSITDIAYFDGKVMVTGVTAGASPSRILELPFPFADNSVATSVEIFHAAHGRVEDATIQTFLPMMIDGKPSLLAGFTCTPLVRFSVDDFEGGEKVRGTTIAELGNRNQPLDMIVYERDGVTSILMSNSARGTMRISTTGIAEREGLDTRVENGGTAGQPFESIDSLSGIQQMDKLDDLRAIAVIDRGGQLTLRTIELP